MTIEEARAKLKARTEMRSTKPVFPEIVDDWSYDDYEEDDLDPGKWVRTHTDP